MGLILTNGRVLSVDENFSTHDTVVVDEGLIVAIGGAALPQSRNPLRSPMERGATVAISSGIPPVGPMAGPYAAGTRKGMTGAVYAEEEAITMEEAIRGYTRTGAWLLFEEDVEVERAWLAGRLVYARQ